MSLFMNTYPQILPPLYNIYQGPTIRPLVTPSVTVTTILNPIEIDSGLDQNPMAQTDVRNDLHYRFLDKWIYHDYNKILKYLKVEGDKVRVVKTEEERQKNDITNDDANINMKKVDFIEDIILTKAVTRKILTKIVTKTGLKWYDLPHYKNIVKDAMARYVTKKLKGLM